MLSFDRESERFYTACTRFGGTMGMEPVRRYERGRSCFQSGKHGLILPFVLAQPLFLPE